MMKQTTPEKFMDTLSDDELAELTIEKWPVMEVSASGKCVVKASDIKTPAGFEIVNKGLYICELTSPESKLDLKLYARRGRGFVTFTQNHDEIKSLGIIATELVIQLKILNYLNLKHVIH